MFEGAALTNQGTLLGKYGIYTILERGLTINMIVET
jgi:hypothetical protein